MRQFKTLLILASLFVFSGCAVINENEDSFKFKYLHSTLSTNFSDLTENLLDDLESKTAKLDKRNPVYVIDFVNIKELENHSELGFMLSEELKTHVSQKLDLSIVSIEYMQFLKIGANGTKFLTRDLTKLKNKKINSNTYAFVGTYAFTQRQLILYLKLIDLSNGVIMGSATSSTSLTDEIISFELNPFP